MSTNKPQDFTMFHKSRPWGYHPEEVEAKIIEYENALKDLNNKYMEQKQISLSLEQRVIQLQNELKDMHFQMSSLELPEPEAAVEHFVLDEFKHYNHTEEFVNNNNNDNDKSDDKNNSNSSNNVDEGFTILC